MSDNSIEGFESSQNEENNSLLNTMKQYNKIDQLPSIINNNNNTENQNSNNSTVNNLINELKENNTQDLNENNEYDMNNQISIEYNIQSNEDSIKILGNQFVKNNKKNVLIKYEREEFELDGYFELKNNDNNNTLNIKLICINNVTDMSYMFSECTSLISLSDISKWNTNNVINMSYMFDQCTSLNSLPDISKWNTNKDTNMRDMFSECISLEFISNLSK